MFDPYTPDKVRGLLKTATWYARWGGAKADKCFASAVKLIEEDRGQSHAELNRVLDEYSGRFRKLGRDADTDRLSALAAAMRQAHPDDYAEDGSDKPWWRQERFRDTIPKFPLELRASRAQDKLGCVFAYAAPAGFVAGCALAALILIPFGKADAGSVFGSGLVAGVVAAVVVQRALDDARARKGAESWCRLTDDGLEYHDPKQHVMLRWPEVERVSTDWESAPGDGEMWEGVAVAVAGRGQRFRLSAQFFTERDVRLVDGVGKLKLEEREASKGL